MGLRPWLRLVREPLAPTAAWDVLAATAMGLGAAGLGVGALGVGRWAAMAGTSLLVYGAGMAGNDLADRDRDRHIAPDRPLPHGDISPRAARIFVLVLAGAAVVVGGGTGAGRWVTAAALALAATYNLVAKHHLVPAALAMGGVRFTNASIGLAPLLVAGTVPPWVLLGPLAVGTYSASIIVLSTTEDGTALHREGWMRILAAAAFLLAGVTAVLAGGPGMGAFLGATLAAGVVLSTLAGRTPRPGPSPKRRVLEMLLGLYFLSWVVGTGGNGGHVLPALAGLAIALGLNFWSQLRMRSLRRRPR